MKNKPSSIAAEIFWLFCVNSVIALFLYNIELGTTFGRIFIVSQVIGLSIYSCVRVSFFLIKPQKTVSQLLSVFVAILLGVCSGLVISSLVAGFDLSAMYGGRPLFFQKFFLFSLLFGVMVSYLFISVHKMAESKALLQEEQIRRLANEKQAAEMHLKMLQAQIEPHFLFNTLSNISTLLDSDLHAGRKMLADLTHYLRSTLTRSRDTRATLGQEIEVLRSYLEIFKVRMADRLLYTINLPHDLENAVCPPLLLQPVVENAIIHGIEPSVNGGEIHINCVMKENDVRITIADTGVGMSQSAHSGLGLQNMQDRLQILYGAKGKYALEENTPAGVKVIIEFPYES